MTPEELIELTSGLAYGSTEWLNAARVCVKTLVRERDAAVLAEREACAKACRSVAKSLADAAHADGDSGRCHTCGGVARAVGPTPLEREKALVRAARRLVDWHPGKQHWDTAGGLRDALAAYEEGWEDR